MVSVCIPAYNNENYILETIQSVLNQTYEDIELIVVDDGSTDNTAAVVQGISDKRLTFYQNESNLGMAGNWNRCLSLCKGEFIKLICADDLLDSDLIRREVEIMQDNPSALLVETDTCFIDIDGTKKGHYPRYYKKGLIPGKKAARFAAFTRDNFGAPLANLIRKSAYEMAGGFDPEFHYIIDYDFYMKIALMGDIYILHEPLNFFRIRKDSNTGEVMGGGQEKRYIAEHRRLIEKHAKALGISKIGVEISVLNRKILSKMGNIYLRIFAK